jgi:hypothetical protein
MKKKNSVKSPNTFAGTDLHSVKKNTGKKKIHSPLGTSHSAKASKKSAFHTKKTSKRSHSK